MTMRLVPLALLVTAVSSARASDEGHVPSARIATGPDAGASRLADHFGLNVAIRLLRSPDPVDRLRGIERAADIGTPEALSLLVRTVSPRSDPLEPHTPVDGAARTDPRGLLAAVRALSGFLDQASARAALVSVVGARTQTFSLHPYGALAQDHDADDQQAAARILLARKVAALALARSAYPSAQDALVALASSEGPGQIPAIEALAIEPPRDMLVRGQALLTPALIGLVGRIGDLRLISLVERGLGSSDESTRAASLVTLAALGDSRALVAAREAPEDPDMGVSLAAAEVLVRLGDGDAAKSVAVLLGRDDTVLRAVELARHVQGDDVTRALVARASETEPPEVRDAAVGALGRQAGASAVAALADLMTNPQLRGASLCALARSPSPLAMSAIETLGARVATRRDAGRAYYIRRTWRGETSSRLDAVVGSLAESRDAMDRAVAVQALVGFGLRPLAQALADPDPRVRRAAAIGSLGRLDAPTARVLLAHRESEPDAVTREVLSAGLVGGEAEALVSTQTLVDRVRAGRADALVAARALVRRVGDRGLGGSVAVDASLDPVMRAQVARALGDAPFGDAVGRLVSAYKYESDARARRAMVRSLAMVAGNGRDTEPTRLLAQAARFDPDSVVRGFARRDAPGQNAVEDAGREVACLRAVPSETSPPRAGLTATIVDADGRSVPVAFDDDGYALVPGLAMGDALVRLAPAMGPYDAHTP
jgi:HEAT repeat protein